MGRTILLVCALSLGACTAGPTGPNEYTAPAVTIHARFVDLPPGEATQASLAAALLKNENGSLRETTGAAAYSQLVAEDAQFLLTEGYAVERAGDIPDLRFFRISAELSTGSPPTDSWVTLWHQPEMVMVYAVREMSWSQFGAGTQTLIFPEGYSWLRRTCGPLPGQVQMEVHPIDEVVELRRRAVSPDTPAETLLGPFAAHWAEQDFLASCGALPAAGDPGTRISFDGTESLVWSRDGASIYYQSIADPSDPNQSVGVRQIRLADLVSSELPAAPYGSDLQMVGSASSATWDDMRLLRVSVARATPTTSPLAPLPAGATASPDGRWAAYQVSAVPSLHIWDVAAGSDLTAIDGSFAGWSPDNRLAYWSPSGLQAVLSVLSPADPASGSRTYPWLIANSYLADVVWTATGPLVVPTNRVLCDGCLGLSLVDPDTGAELPVLDATAGWVRMATRQTEVGFVYASATTCPGLLRTVCSSSLFRVNLSDASLQTVAIPSTISAVSISSDGHRLALGGYDGIFVRDLPW